MAEIVFAAGAPHAPGLIGVFDAAPAYVKDVVSVTYRSLGTAIASAKPDVALNVLHGRPGEEAPDEGDEAEDAPMPHDAAHVSTCAPSRSRRR